MQLTVREVARLLDTSENTIYRWVRERGLPAHRMNEQYRFNRAELLEWVTAHQDELPAGVLRGMAGGAEARHQLSAALERGGIVYGVRGAEKEEVFRSVVEAMKLPARTPPEQLLRVLLAREAMASTGIGDGIAVPHARNPIVLKVAEPSVTLCFLERPIEFDALDGQPVHTLFVLVTPNPRVHLDLLSRVAYALRHPGFRAALDRRAPAAEIIAAAREVEAGLEPGPPAGSAARG